MLPDLVFITLLKPNDDPVHVRVDRIIAVDTSGLGARVVLEGDWSFDVTETVELVLAKMQKRYESAADTYCATCGAFQ